MKRWISVFLIVVALGILFFAFKQRRDHAEVKNTEAETQPAVTQDTAGEKERDLRVEQNETQPAIQSNQSETLPINPRASVAERRAHAIRMFEQRLAIEEEKIKKLQSQTDEARNRLAIPEEIAVMKPSVALSNPELAAYREYF